MSFRASIERLKESSPDSLQIDWIPQAVLGKPTSFFERILGKFSFGSDDLDDFEGADFLLIVESDRKVPFSLRHYKGYPANTTAIYLPIQVEELEEIEFFVSAIVDALDLNVDLLEWRRSDNPEF